MRQKARLFFSVVIITLLTVGTVLSVSANGQGESKSSASSKVVTVKLGVPDPQDSSVGVTAKHFADLVSTATDGKVKVNVFYNGVLFGGDQNAAVNMVENGSMDATILSTSVYASFIKQMNAISLPYMFKNYKEFESYLGGAPGQELLASLSKLNTVGLALMIRTFRDVTNSVRPITSPADLKGLKLRVPNNKLWVVFFSAMGADPVPMNFKEVYTALQLKTIDGQENPVEVPLANKFYEVQKYLSITQHIGDSFALTFNKNVWDRFDAATQAKLRKAAVETAAFKANYDLSNEKKIINELKAKGMQVNTLTEAQTAAFQNAAIKLYPQFEQLVGADFMAKSLKFLHRSMP